MLSKIKEWIAQRDDQEIKKIRKTILPQIDKYVQRIKHDSDLNKVSIELRRRIRQGEDRQDSLFLAFALVKEAVRRVFGITMYDAQLIGGWLLCEGKIPKMMIGEGKTIVHLLPAYWFGLQDHGVHMYTVNEYLAKREHEQMGKVFQLLGLSVGLNLAGLKAQAKKAAYQQDITYGTYTEFGLDCLRDQRILHPEQRIQRGFAYAVLDEMDRILIDEARTPLMISDPVKAAPKLYSVCEKFVRGMQEVSDYEVDRQSKQVMFTPSKAKKIEAALKDNSLYELDHTTVYHYLLVSLQAKVLMQRDVDYIVADDRIHFIDPLTGRIIEGRQFNDGLRQAIEAKEHIPLSEGNQAAMTVQKLLGLYKQIIGVIEMMKTKAEELRGMYDLEVVTVPSHLPVTRRSDTELQVSRYWINQARQG